MGINRHQAEILASRHYLTFILRDDTRTKDPIFKAKNYEIRDCIGEGDTPESALERLNELRVDYIEHLLDMDAPVPFPRLQVKSVSQAEMDVIAEGAD